MSALDAILTTPRNVPHEPIRPGSHPHSELPARGTLIREVVEHVRQKIAPVWPLKDYVAVNPYVGYADQEFLTARTSLRSVSDLETLMPVAHYREQFTAGSLCRADIDAAVDEMVADGVVGAERIDVNQVVALLRQPPAASPQADTAFAQSGNPGRVLRTLADVYDQYTGSTWSQLILDEISRHCASHYDEGQAHWPSPTRELPLYHAWKLAASHNRSFEILGVAGLRKLAAGLPHDPLAAVEALLKQMSVPESLWADLLRCEALTMPGWCAWANYQYTQSHRRGEENTDLAGLLAMRLAHEVALSVHFDFHVDWASVATYHHARLAQVSQPADEDLLRYALLKASEIAFRQQLLAGLAGREDRPSPPAAERPLAQLVFCIDVRSERMRRHVESKSPAIETFGFAGFFGLPIEFVALGESCGRSQVPVLIAPQFRVREEVDGEDTRSRHSTIQRRSLRRFLRGTWKEFQSSAASCFASVETCGLLYGLPLLARSMGKCPSRSSRFDGVASDQRERLAPTLRGLEQLGIGTSRLTDMAESMLRGIGLVNGFARLVVFCGHGSQTENNPLQAALDCGACGGHSGEPNARFAARLLNQPHIRSALAERGIVIPPDTHFLAGLHNTTTDELQFFDQHQLPTSHRGDLESLSSIAESASCRVRQERLSRLPGADTHDLVRRSRDWSEVRPEWGLAGNAAFIAAPRELTRSLALDGRVFLHSYDYRSDQEFTVLEQIMTAPLIVANWINMQYYATTVDPLHFGSGNKTVHNVVGRFGIFAGNGGDLQTGLPWQSIHDGRHYQHQALRLLALFAAPRSAIEAIIARHDMLKNLLTHGWVQLIAVEQHSFYRYNARRTWDAVVPSATGEIAAEIESQCSHVPSVDRIE